MSNALDATAVKIAVWVRSRGIARYKKHTSLFLVMELSATGVLYLVRPRWR
jgi:hypothetical protein